MYFKMTSDVLLQRLSLLWLNPRLISKSQKPVTVSGSKIKSGSHCQTFAFGVHFAPLSHQFFLGSFFYLLKKSKTASVQFLVKSLSPPLKTREYICVYIHV